MKIPKKDIYTFLLIFFGMLIIFVFDYKTGGRHRYRFAPGDAIWHWQLITWKEVFSYWIEIIYLSTFCAVGIYVLYFFAIKKK